MLSLAGGIQTLLSSQEYYAPVARTARKSTVRFICLGLLKEWGSGWREVNVTPSAHALLSTAAQNKIKIHCMAV
jgi:hypothetical protein